MDARHFDALTQALTSVGARRGLLGLMASLPLLGGLAAFLAPDETDAKGRRKRRKKRHKHGNGRRRKHKPHKNKPCQPQPAAQTCAGKCGSVQNNCKKSVDCGPCTCDPACGACERCTGTTCQPCAPCCDDICCTEANAICHTSTHVCCVPEAKATTCEGQCGPMVNNCGVTVACGSCVCDPLCPTCQICDEDTGACVADPEQKDDPCGPAQTCDQGAVTPRGSCHAGGTCVPADPVSCAPYALCDGSDACATTCGSTADCRAGFFCDQDHHCVSEHGDGQSCAIDEECSSGFCVQNVCCDTVCDGPCEVCDASGDVGTCTITVGASCGTSTCAAGVLTPAPTCQANGQCQSGAPISCTPYLHCDGSEVCATSCGDDNDCTGSSYCNDAHHCVGDEPGGQPCDDSGQCASGYCVNDVCCDTACDGPCEVCNASGDVGTCTVTVGATCGTSTCAAGMLTPAPTCLASGACQPSSPVSCSPYKACAGSNACATTCGVDNDCVTGAFCDGSAHCVAKYPAGFLCGRDSACQSGYCVEGVCCQSDCDSTCHTCDAPGSRGFCVPRTSGTPCGSDQICCCGACQAGPTCGTGAAFGAACTSDGDCASGLCGCTAADCAGGGICIDRYDCDPAGCFAADQSNYLIIHPGGDQLTCGVQSGSSGGCPCPAGQVCHITAQLCVIPYDVPVITTPA